MILHTEVTLIKISLLYVHNISTAIKSIHLRNNILLKMRYVRRKNPTHRLAISYIDKTTYFHIKSTDLTS